MPAAEAATEPSSPRASLRPRLRGLTGDTLGSLGINVAQALLGFAATVTLTRILGADGYGAYAFAFAWATVLSVPSVVGLTPLVVRNIASYREHGRWDYVRGIIRTSNQVVAAASAIVAAVAAAAAWLVVDPDSDLLSPFLVGMVLVPLVALTTMRQAAMQGLGRVVVGRLPETLVAPGLLLALLLAAAVVTGSSYSPAAALALQAAATAIAFGLGVWLLVRTLPTPAKQAEPAYETGAWLRGGLALLAASIALAVNGQIGTILLGALKGSADAGVYAAATRVALFAGFLYLAATYPLMPALARLHAQGATPELARVTQRAVRAILAASLPLIAVLFVFAPQILDVFGARFDEGAATLRILLAGELVKIATGFAALLLLMTARERRFARITVAGTALNLAATAALIPLLGVAGAALATAASVVVMNVGLLIAAQRDLGVWAAAIPLRAVRRPGSSADR